VFAPFLVLFASAVGLAAFLYPFLIPLMEGSQPTVSSSRGESAPTVFAMVTMVSLTVILAELAARQVAPRNSAKVAALLGAVVAVDASLRLVPSIGGASPIFVMIILVGSVFGGRLGFLTGAMTLLVSAAITGGIGPWLPYQMLGAGWIGLGAGLIPRPKALRRRLLYLAFYGLASGFLYGALLNLYSWPFAAPGLDEAAGLYWNPTLSFGETIENYARFYLVTSLGHDALRGVGNAVLLIALGVPIVKTLERARQRFSWQTPTFVSTTGIAPDATAADRPAH
jgi:energy-coupling factor transport system substrate-specific component